MNTSPGDFRRAAAITGILVALAVTSWAGGDQRVITHREPARGLRMLSLDTGVGDVTVTAGETDEILARVTLKPRRSGIPFLGSRKKGRRQVHDARLHAGRSGDVLELTIVGPGKDRHFEERWEVTVPARLALDLDVGVGDVEVRGVAGGVTVDAGVGDVSLDVPGGDITIDAGVGDVRISLPEEAVGPVDVDGGVGGCTIHTAETVVRGKDLGGDVSWKGTGTASIDVDAGVGDVEIFCTHSSKGRGNEGRPPGDRG